MYDCMYVRSYMHFAARRQWTSAYLDHIPTPWLSVFCTASCRVRIALCWCCIVLCLVRARPPSCQPCVCNAGDVCICLRLEHLGARKRRAGSQSTNSSRQFSSGSRSSSSGLAKSQCGTIAQKRQDKNNPQGEHGEGLMQGGGVVSNVGCVSSLNLLPFAHSWRRCCTHQRIPGTTKHRVRGAVPIRAAGRSNSSSRSYYVVFSKGTETVGGRTKRPKMTNCSCFRVDLVLNKTTVEMRQNPTENKHQACW